MKRTPIAGTHKIIYLDKSPIHGIGIFTDEHIDAGTVIGIAHIKLGDKNYHVTPIGRMHNHQINPTCINILRGNKRYLVAMRDLAPGTELTTNYRLQPDLEQPKKEWLF